MPVTREALRDASEKAAAAQEALRSRDALIRLAVKQGWTHSQIADATGLTRGRVGQIALQRP